MGLGFAINFDLLAIHIHEYVELSALGTLMWGVFVSLLYRWLGGRVLKVWDKWYDKHPVSHAIFHHHIKGHPAPSAWLCDKDGCRIVQFEDDGQYPPHGHH